MQHLRKSSWIGRFFLSFLALALILALFPVSKVQTAGDPMDASAVLAGTQSQSSGGGTLKATDKDGFPVPDNYTDYAGEKSAYLRSITATSPSPLKTVFAFYDRELKSRSWRQLPGGAGITDAKALLLFENGKKERLALDLTRNGKGETDIRITVKSKEEAMKDGVLPSSGKARIYLGNMTEGQAEFIIGQKKYMLKKQSTNDGSMKNAPFVEVPPGVYSYTLTVAGQKPVKDKIKVGADEIWGLIAGPGGGLPLQMY